LAAHGISAREVIGWLRVVRPGSVVGAQQHYLCRLGDALQRRSFADGAAGLRDAVLSLEPAEEDRTQHKASTDRSRALQLRCSSVPRSRRPSRIRPQSEF
jgi:hypothetical protein